MNRAIASVGVAKQADKATIATNPTFWHGVSSGAMASVEVKDEVADVTTGLGAPALAYRAQADLPTGFKTLTFSKAVGLYLLGVLGNVATTDASGTRTHVFDMGETLPWLTFFSELDDWKQKNGQSKIDELTFEWDGPKPLRMTVVAQGCSFALPATITAPTPDEMLGTFFTPVGGTFKGDVDGSTLANWNVLGGKITFKRNLVVDFFSTAITPGDLGESALQTLISLKVRASSWADWQTIVTGSATGTTIGGSPVIGSFETKFMSGGDTLTFEGARVKYSSKMVEADPKGGPVELALEGECMVAAAGESPITATLVNTTATY